LLPTDPSAGPQQYPRFVLGPASLRSSFIASASTTFDSTTKQWAVTYKLTSAGSQQWDQAAQAQFHQYVAFDLNGLIESAPIIEPGQATFSSFGGRGEIIGNFTMTKAKDLTLELNYGPLATPLQSTDLER
jgi:SecD/SecF fusion protein